ncbi:TPA: ABC transporter substrate-binding protein [Candidatus Micrarchaeota archaeon]|nr:ABC transporter substrate-binding protein [Candidatus Micrarchaeota archaeon]
MKFKQSWIAAAVALVALAMVLTFFTLASTGALAGKTQNAGSEKETLKVGFIPAAFYLPLYVAMEKGYFAEEGFDVKYVRFESVSDQVNALVKGDIDISGVGSAGGFAAESRSPGSLKFIYGQDLHSYSFMVAKGSNITSLSELKRKRIGTWQSPTPLLLIKLVLSKSFNSSEVETVQMDATLLNQALASGQVDAIFINDVFTQVGIERGLTRYLEKDPVSDHVFNPFFNGGGIVSAKSVRDNPQKAARIQRALEKAIAFIDSNPEEARKTMLQYLPFEESVVLNAPLDWFYPLSRLNVANAQKVADTFYEDNVIASPLEASKLFWSGR